jgi:putative ABC transport system permease protein
MVFRNYLITAFRNLTQHKLHSFINIAGLAVGLACAIFISLFLRDELSYDKWIPDSENVYRTEINFAVPGRELLKLAVTPFAMPASMPDQIPEVKAMTRLMPETMAVTVGDRQFSETVDVVDPQFFQVIKLPLVEGDPASVLIQPESVVLSQSAARKYFGESNPLGKTITLSGTSGGGSGNGKVAVHPLTVTGILRDLPHNTHLVADVVLPNTSQADRMTQADKEDWTSQQGYGYVLLAPNADPNTVIAKLDPIIDQHVNPMKEAGWKLRGSEVEQPHLTPFQDAHLTTDNNSGGGMKPPGSWTTIYGFAVIALLIVLVACINFMNLATARATLRAREISLRKAVGATRRQLVVQFLGEAVMIALVALVVALAVVEVLLPVYDRFLDRPIAFHYLADWQLFLAITVTAIAAGLLGGAYPALFLSSFRPATAPKVNASGPSGSGLTRTTLVVLQFAVSIGLGIAAIVVFRQIDFARNAELGFNRDGVIIIVGGDNLTVGARESFAHALANHPTISSVAQSSAAPFGRAWSNGKVQIPGQSQILVFRTMDISPEFPDLYEMKLLAGRLLSRARGEDVLSVNLFAPNLSKPNPTDETRNILINSEGAHRLGWTAAQAVGRTVILNDMLVMIAGVLADTKIDGLKGSVLPMVYLSNPDENTVFSVRIHEGAVSDTLGYIDRTWRAFAPAIPIRRYFLSEAFDGLFKADEKQGQIFSFFVGIAIVIACLGLFGLAAFTAQHRTQEIGVRKVFGARGSDIVRLLMWQFSVPVLIANVIAWPIAYYYLHHWLESYAYRISLNLVYFFAAGTMALLIAWVTVFVHALRIAHANPIHALRYE